MVAATSSFAETRLSFLAQKPKPTIKQIAKKNPTSTRPKGFIAPSSTQGSSGLTQARNAYLTSMRPVNFVSSSSKVLESHRKFQLGGQHDSGSKVNSRNAGGSIHNTKMAGTPSTREFSTALIYGGKKPTIVSSASMPLMQPIGHKNLASLRSSLPGPTTNDNRNALE